jgi:tetratricopeptide (TPR) repeat protein
MKAGVFACLFFCTPIANCQSLEFNNRELVLYNNILDLKVTDVVGNTAASKRTEEEYIITLAETIHLLVQENEDEYDRYERAFERRKNLGSKSAAEQFLQAENRLQWAFVSLKFGHEVDAAFNLRQAYQIAQACKKKHPDFLPIYKTTGLLNIVVGAVPEKYNWLLNLMGLEGSIETGVAELSRVAESKSDFGVEARLLLGLAEGFIFQKPAEGLSHLQSLLSTHNQKVFHFFAGALAVKNSQSELALNYLKPLTTDDPSLLPYAQYLLGEIHLHKASYEEAIRYYQSFLSVYAGTNYVKDAHYKTGICKLLNGDKLTASTHFEKARRSGKEVVEADIYATKALQETDAIVIRLAKARYATDGGYYADAERILREVSATDLLSKKSQVECYYRKARLAHKQNNVDGALLLYKQVIEMSDRDDAWYFAPNAALQSGYIKLASGDETGAKELFEKALSYKKHEYKNSIDSKAKSALAQINAR